MSFVRIDNTDRINSDAIKITKDEAKALQWKFLDSWQPLKDVAILKYGGAILGAVAGISAYSTCTYYRTKVNLRSFGHFTIYAPGVIVPTVICSMFHKYFITSEIILEPTCIVCNEVRAVGIQSIFGVLQPLVIGPISCYMIANVKNTARIPRMFPDWRGLLRYHTKISRSFYSQSLPWIVLANTMIPIILTYLEYRNMFTITEKIRKIEEYGDRIGLAKEY